MNNGVVGTHRSREKVQQGQMQRRQPTMQRMDTRLFAAPLQTGRAFWSSDVTRIEAWLAAEPS